MGSVETNPGVQNTEPELNLLMKPEEPLWKSLFGELDEFFFPKKLPPLKLDSKPIAVKSIWGDYNYRKNGALGSTVVHVIIAAIIIGGAIWVRRMVAQPTATMKVIPLVDPGDLPILKPSKTQVGGGGGGGDKDVLQASKGRLPKQSLQQITPPTVIVRNEAPKLAVDPTILVPPEVKLASNNMPNLGDPMSGAMLPSNGTGSGSGIGSGSGGGVGKGTGGGFGPGEGGGTGGGIFHVGGGVSAPRVTFQVDPEFSEEARKAKFQGTCTLMLVVDASGRPTNIRVANSLGMGLDEKAIEAAKKWRFEPAMKDGHPVAVEIALEVDFHLY